MFSRLFFSISILLTSSCLAEDVTVVLAGTSEIGQEIVKTVSNRGQKVLVIGRDRNKLDRLSERYNCDTFNLDFADLDSLASFGESIRNRNFTISGFVLITPRPPFFDEALPSEQAWSEMFQLCYTRPLEVLKMSLPLFSENARLVILSGVTSVQALPEYASYGVLRKMWLAEAKSLAWNLGSKKITVNTVSPGLVITSHHLKKWKEEASLKGMELKDLMTEKAKSYPSRKITTKKDVAEAILFFLEGNSNITGQNLVVDGGLSQAY